MTGKHVAASPRVAVVIDDMDRRARLTEILSHAGVDVMATGDMEAALATDADIVVVDVAAGATVNGALLELLERAAPPTVVVAETAEMGVVALEAGAADYVVEPVDGRELLARVLLRSGTASTSVVARGDLRIDRSARRVFVRGREIDLTSREFALLEYLAVRPRRVFSRKQLLGAVWGASTEWQDPATVTEHVYRLRHKIESDPNHPEWIVTVRGSGYRFDG